MSKKDINTEKESASKKSSHVDTSADKKALEDKIKELENLLEEKSHQLEQTEENWKRALADYKNLERRTLQEKEDLARFANFVLVAELIAIYDNLEMLKKHSEDQGLKMIADQFGEILENAGLERLDVLGKPFDERHMEAVDTQEGPENQVIEEVLTGYKFKERLVRPAKVVVGK